MCFTKICLEQDPCFLDKSKVIPVFDGLLEFSSLLDDVVGLRDCLRVRIGEIGHVAVFEKVFNSVKNIFD